MANASKETRARSVPVRPLATPFKHTESHASGRPVNGHGGSSGRFAFPCAVHLNNKGRWIELMRHQFPVMLAMIGSADQNADLYERSVRYRFDHRWNRVYVLVFNGSEAAGCHEGQPGCIQSSRWGVRSSIPRFFDRCRSKETRIALDVWNWTTIEIRVRETCVPVYFYIGNPMRLIRLSALKVRKPYLFVSLASTKKIKIIDIN